MTYTIKKGDTLTSIAKAYNTSVDALAGANGIKNKNVIYAGDTITVPEAATLTATGTVDTSPAGYGSGALREVEKAAEALGRWRQEKPPEYESAYSERLDNLLSLLSGRSFSYDAESDPLYKQYRDSYTREARLAMLDTLGKTTSLTGGFANSYAAGAAGGSYNEKLQKLSAVIPELYKAAYSRFSDEGDSIASEIKLLQSMDKSDWDKYSDMLDAYLKKGSSLMDSYAELSDDEYDRMLDYAALLKKYAS